MLQALSLFLYLFAWVSGIPLQSPTLSHLVSIKSLSVCFLLFLFSQNFMILKFPDNEIIWEFRKRTFLSSFEPGGEALGNFNWFFSSCLVFSGFVLKSFPNKARKGALRASCNRICFDHVGLRIFQSSVLKSSKSWKIGSFHSKKPLITRQRNAQPWTFRKSLPKRGRKFEP